MVFTEGYVGWSISKVKTFHETRTASAVTRHIAGVNAFFLFIISVAIDQVRCHNIMSTVIVVELRRLGWSQKIVKKSFIIEGRSPYAETIKLLEDCRKVLAHEKCRRKRNVGESWFSTTAPGLVSAQTRISQ
jgi:hypothetical protein